MRENYVFPSDSFKLSIMLKISNGNKLEKLALIYRNQIIAKYRFCEKRETLDQFYWFS